MKMNARSLIALGLVLVSCDTGQVELSTLDAPRVMAVRATPAALQPGETITLTALAWDVETFSWDACPAPWIPGQELSCPTDPIPLGSGNPLEVTLPPLELDVLYLRLLTTSPNGDPLPTVRPLFADVPAENPRLVGLENDEGPLPESVATKEAVRVAIRLDDPPAGQVTSFFTSHGKFDPWRAFEEQSAVFRAPAEAGMATIFAVTRDSDGGASWLETSIEVLP